MSLTRRICGGRNGLTLSLRALAFDVITSNQQYCSDSLSANSALCTPAAGTLATGNLQLELQVELRTEAVQRLAAPRRGPGPRPGLCRMMTPPAPLGPGVLRLSCGGTGTQAGPGSTDHRVTLTSDRAVV